jgi:hypothetical protein
MRKEQFKTAQERKQFNDLCTEVLGMLDKCRDLRSEAFSRSFPKAEYEYRRDALKKCLRGVRAQIMEYNKSVYAKNNVRWESMFDSYVNEEWAKM